MDVVECEYCGGFYLEGGGIAWIAFIFWLVGGWGEGKDCGGEISNWNFVGGMWKSNWSDKFGEEKCLNKWSWEVNRGAYGSKEEGLER